MRKEDLIAFARRDWQAIEARKRKAISDQMSRMQPEEVLAIGDALRDHASALLPDWPTDDDRKKDLAVHIRVSESLRRVATPTRR